MVVEKRLWDSKVKAGYNWAREDGCLDKAVSSRGGKKIVEK